jgi:hypothetical protein
VIHLRGDCGLPKGESFQESETRPH